MLHVENVFSPTTLASGFAAGPEFTPDVSSLAFLSGAIERVIGIGSKAEILIQSGLKREHQTPVVLA
ncbi:MAG TPA: hypothetical protein VMW72_09510 [Sedimentisphaerales bacterium]|nr:hypothetical protein [Sedimentisphaerales bacterium]